MSMSIEEIKSIRITIGIGIGIGNSSSNDIPPTISVVNWRGIFCPLLECFEKEKEPPHVQKDLLWKDTITK